MNDDDGRRCPHLLRIWIPIGASDARPWAVTYKARYLACVHTGRHDVHAAGRRRWR